MSAGFCHFLNQKAADFSRESIKLSVVEAP
jgi:hypothetical protein